MRIALCDDERLHIEQISKVLDDYRSPDKEGILYDVYMNSLDLLSAINKVEYDAILLDVIMPELSGIEVARDIRRDNKSIPIVFLTTSPEFAVESYRVHAFDYLMKPVNKEDLFCSLNDIYAQKTSRKNDSLTVTFAKGAYIIPFEQLVFLEVSKHKLIFHLLDGSCYTVGGKLSDYEGLLLSKDIFIKVHRSFIVNMDHMKSYDKKRFTAMTGENIAISRNVAKEVQDRYMDYLHAVVRVKNR